MSKHKSTRNATRDPEGICHICGGILPLSKDHVPPQGAAGKNDVIVDLVYPDFADQIARQQSSVAQGGTSFLRACRQCNSLLGKYDRALSDLSSTIHKALESGLDTSSTTVVIRPGALCRSLLGHILVAKPHINPEGFDEKVRKYILDGNAELPEGLYISYWSFPHRLTYINPELVTIVPTKTGLKPAILRLLKFYPVAYLVCDQDIYNGLGTLTPYASLPPNQTVEIEVQLRPTPAPNWPEEANPLLVITAGGANAMYTQSRKRKQ